jgi:Tfp pilus assembly protein PilV
MRFITEGTRSFRGFTFIDVLTAVLVIGLAFGGVFAANTRAMGLLKSAKQAAVASKCLQQRIEQLRNYNWAQVTDSAALQDLYNTPPLPSVELPGFTEQITVSSFTAPAFGATSGTPEASGQLLQITRDVNGAVGLLSDNVDLVNQPMIRIDVQIQWPGTGGIQRTRQTSVIIANGGLGR